MTWLLCSHFLQLRGLIILYLTVEKGGASTGKTQIPSINEVLQSGKVTRDKGWVSFVNECHRIDYLDTVQLL
jgi:hypothetical protein